MIESDLLSPLRLNVGFIIHQSAGYSRVFSYDIQDISFAPDLELSNLSGISRVTRTPQGLLVQVEMQAVVSLECVRCLTPFTQILNTNFTELYAFSPKHVTDSNLLVPEDGQLNLSPLVREYMLLEVPLSPLCKADCKGLCLVCGENFNEYIHHHQDEPDDPRLVELKKLLE